MNQSIKKGLGFGLTSGIITTLGMMIGLATSTDSSRIVIIGILAIAVSDSFSDSLGVHMIEESDPKSSNKNIWLSTFSTFIFKFLFTMSFSIPVYFITNLYSALVVSIIWGILLIIILSYIWATERKRSIIVTIFEHLSIMILVIIITYFLGNFIKKF